MKIKYLLIAVALLTLLIPTTVFAAGGFDKFGYNETANIFRGPADGVDRLLDGKVWGDPTYANDLLVMKWNEQWDVCNDAGSVGVEACLGAWTTNEWNGMVPGGSGETWHYKIIWVGPGGLDSPYWVGGGELAWDNYETIMSQGTSDGAHSWATHATPTGFGNQLSLFPE